MKKAKRFLYKTAVLVLLITSSVRVSAGLFFDPAILTALLDLGVTTSSQLTTLTKVYESMKQAYSIINAGSNVLNGVKAVDEMFELIDQIRADYADVANMIERVKNTYGASTVMPSSVYSTTIAAASLGLELTNHLINIMESATEDMKNGSLNFGQKLERLEKLNEKLEDTRKKIQEIKNKLTGAIIFSVENYREKGESAMLVAQAYGEFGEKEAFLNKNPDKLNDPSEQGSRKSEKGVLPTIDWHSVSVSSPESSTLKNLESTVRDGTLVGNVFHIVQYVIIGIGLLFTAVSYARRNKGDRASTDAIYKVILWFFLIMMMMSCVEAMFF